MPRVIGLFMADYVARCGGPSAQSRNSRMASPRLSGPQAALKRLSTSTSRIRIQSWSLPLDSSPRPRTGERRGWTAEPERPSVYPHPAAAVRAAQLDVADLAAGVVAVQDGRPGFPGGPAVAPAHHHQEQVAQLLALRGEQVLVA